MLMMEGALDSRVLHFPCAYAVALPDSALSGARCPAALWLHDLGENRGTLPKRVALEPLVEYHHIALIMPDGRRSCFLNMARGPKWNDFLAQELVPQLARTLPFAREDIGVIGKGTGALGALRLARLGYRCALIEPALGDVDARDEGRWPLEGEWLGVFEDREELWRRGVFEDADGMLLGSEAAVNAAAERFGLEHWRRNAGEDSGIERWLDEALEFVGAKSEEWR